MFIMNNHYHYEKKKNKEFEVYKISGKYNCLLRRIIMRKIKIICLMGLMLLLSVMPIQAVEANKEELDLDAQSAILIDAQSGTVLYNKNAFEKQYPASITKIMTVYLAVKNGNLNQTVTASETAIDSIDRSSSHIWLDYGEELSLEDACYAAMLQSANDASNVLAEAIGVTQENFAEMMNEAAIEAGALGTHFSNAHGLPDEEHYTTAYDMAMILKMALNNDAFRTIFEAYNYTMEPTNKQKDQRIFATGNELIKKGTYRYEYAKGGKVGWTADAGYTMVATAEKDGMELIAVVLKDSSKESRFSDITKLFEYGFSNYKTVMIKANEQPAQTYQVTKGKQIAADCTFTMEHDFRVLLDSDAIVELLTVDYEIRNKESADTVECYAILKNSGLAIGEQQMKKEMVVYDLSFKAVVLPKIMNVVDFLCVGVFAMMMGLCVLSLFSGKKK